MEKKLYYELMDNADLGATCKDLKECMDMIEAHLSDLSDEEKEEVEFTITPCYLTDEEFNELGE